MRQQFFFSFFFLKGFLKTSNSICSLLEPTPGDAATPPPGPSERGAPSTIRGAHGAAAAAARRHPARRNRRLAEGAAGGRALPAGGGRSLQ